jgi:L-lactate dehydrogenase (cytochrome)
MDEVEKHATKDDGWLVLFGEAIDVTQFIPLHPGGEDTIVAYLGKDATADWTTIHRPEHLEKYMTHLTKKRKNPGQWRAFILVTEKD